MTEQPPLIDAEVMAKSIRPPKPRQDWYVVLAQWHGGWWKLFAEGWLTQGKAEEMAAALPGGYTHIRIVRIPGE